MAETILDRGMLKTRVPERRMSVSTSVDCAHHRACGCSAWTAVWAEPGPSLVWLHFWHGPATPGGLEEAHYAIAAQVRAGTLPVSSGQASVAGERRERT